MKTLTTLDCGSTLVKLMQDAYISDCGDYYFASGEYIEDKETFVCMVRWDVKEDYNETDESESCDSEDFYIEELGRP